MCTVAVAAPHHIRGTSLCPPIRATHPTPRNTLTLTPCYLPSYTPVPPQEALELVRPDALRVYVGKRGGRESIKQHQIDQLLVEHCTKARAGQAAIRGGQHGLPVGGGIALVGEARGPVGRELQRFWPRRAYAGIAG